MIIIEGKRLENIFIGNVRMDMRFYKDKDEYSDGEIEEEILEIVKENNDLEIACYQTDSFAVYYHLSKERELITEPMYIRKNDSVLEVGSGCGAITGALAEKANSVDCIELSKRRSMINAYRHKKYGNIQIYVGNYEDIKVDKEYDVITLIGVFEYASYYIHSEKPYENFLVNLRKKLKKGGRIYIAIENRLGAKYFAGCMEDHNGKVYSGIEGYVEDIKARTFSYYELQNLFMKAGFQNFIFYYPYPDYKFPLQIYSDDFLPYEGSITMKGSNYSTSRIEVFDEIKFWNSLHYKEEFRMFANSFLVELRK